MAGNASGCFKNVIILTSLSRNFFTDLRKASVDMLKPQFASSISLSASDFLSSFFIFKKKLGEGTSTQQSKVTLLFSLTCSVDFLMLMISPYNKPAFQTLIAPSFKSLNPFVTFFRPLQPHSSSHNWGKYENSRFSSDAFAPRARSVQYIQKMQSRETSRAPEIKSPLNE